MNGDNQSQSIETTSASNMGENLSKELLYPRQEVKRLREDIEAHFDNEMRLTREFEEAKLSTLESAYLVTAMLQHPHFTTNVKGKLCEIAQTFLILKELL